MAIDRRKRSILKALSAATGVMAVPGIAAATNIGVQQSNTPPYETTPNEINTDLIISFTDTHGIDGTRDVIVTNTSHKPVNLSLVYPSVVSTPDGLYDVNSLLVNGTRTFAPKQSIRLSIKPTTRVATNKSTPWMRPADSMIGVRTQNSRINGGAPVTTTRAMYT